MKRLEQDDGLRYALIAYSYFRTRNNKVARFKRPNQSHKDLKVSRRAEWARMARKYIRLARECGWMGSFIKAVMEEENK